MVSFFKDPIFSVYLHQIALYIFHSTDNKFATMASTTAQLQNPGDLGYNGFPVLLFYLAPVDLEAIGDHNVAIVFKNIMKKNAVTREKGLTEFLRMIEGDAFDISDYNILACWLQIYPRMGIDASKTVRMLAVQIEAMYMEKYGAKEFSKYLKSSMPTWLNALYDERSIAAAARAGLLSCFGNDQERVDAKIWVVFHEQIVNYCHAALVHETPASLIDQRYENAEELVLKYNRTVNSAVQMLLKLVRLVNSRQLTMSEVALSQFEDILSSEALWDLLGLSLSKDSLSMPLLKTLLTFIVALFSFSEQSKLSPVIDSLSDLKGIYKVVSKKFIKHVKIDGSQNRVLYSSVAPSLVEALATLTSASSVELNSKKHKLKKNFWVLGGSKSFSRLRDYLKLGPCNSEPIYFEKLTRLFVAIDEAGIESNDEFQFLDFSDHDHAKLVILKILLPQLDLFKGMDLLSFKYHFTSCVFQTLSLFSLRCDTTSDLNIAVYMSLLDSFATPALRGQQDLKKKCLENFDTLFRNVTIDHLSATAELVATIGLKPPFQVQNQQLKASSKQLCITYFDTLGADNDNENNFVAALLEKIDECYEPEELQCGLEILLHILTSSNTRYDSIIEWSQSLPSLVSETFVELPIAVFEALLKSESKSNFKDLFEDFFTKIMSDAPSHMKKLLSLLSEQDTFNIVSLEESFPEAHAYLLELSQKLTRLKDEEHIIYSYLHDKEIFQNLLDSEGSEYGAIKFRDFLLARGEAVSALEQASPAIAYIIKKCFVGEIDPSNEKFLSLFTDKSLIQATIFDHLQERYVYSNDAINFMASHPDVLPFSQLGEAIEAAISCIDLRPLALANRLGHDIVLIQETKKLQLMPSIIPLGEFLASLLESDQSQAIVELASLYLEYLSDFEFLVNAEEVPEGLSVVTSRLESLLENLCCISKDNLVDLANGNAEKYIFIDFAASVSGKGPFNSSQFYRVKVLARAIDKGLENVSQHEFDAFEIKYTQLVSHPLRLALILSSCDKFIASSPKLDRLRTYVFSEILGVRNNDIMTSGLTWLCLSTHFIETADYGSILAGHKMAMVYNKLWDWLNSDIAFDAEFIPMRYLISIFLTKLIENHGAVVPDKVWEISIDLCLNNLSTSQVEPNTLSLRYSTMKLFTALNRQMPDASVEWKESRKAIYEELLAILTDQSIETESIAVNNSPVSICNDLIARTFSRATVPTSIITPKVSQLYEVLNSSKFVSLQRVAVGLLKSYILESQQDLVIEYQLKKANLKGSQEELEISPKLPEPLLSTIEVANNGKHLEDLVEEGADSQAARFIWSWYLIFMHFQDTTFNLKSEYINQIRGDGNVEFLLDTIFDTIWPNDISFLNQLVLSPIEKGTKVTQENCLIQKYDILEGFAGHVWKEEIHFALVHLYYLSFQYLGSQVQQWYNNIRDLQQKQTISKFSENYLSPLLVTKMLDEVESSKDKLIAADENLTIRVNRVTNEIKSIYIIDEQTMEMVVKIPQTYPLSSVAVEGPLRLGVKENQWKAWLLASQRVISLTNGSIIESIELFNRNVNLHFSGFVECAICYSILHQDHSLPSKTCPTCLNKFHSACLYKWFKSSGSSTCPLCRCTFNFQLARG